MMNTIGKECAKKVKTEYVKVQRTRKGSRQFEYDKKFLSSCCSAVRNLHELNLYINHYKRDSDYKASVRKLCDRVKNMKTTEGLESDYGQLMFEGRMKFRRANQPKYEDNCYLMCFQTRILTFEVEDDEEKSGWRFGSKTDSNQENYIYIGSIKVTRMMVLMSDEQGTTPGTLKGHGTITINSMENMQINNQESFSVMVPLGEEMKELKGQFAKLIADASERPDDKHRMHDYHTNIPKHDIQMRDPQPPPKCGECNLYLFGLLFMGYKCETCKLCYHKDCFLKGQATDMYGMLPLISINY